MKNNINNLKAGAQVKHEDDPANIGILTGKVREQAGIKKYQVAFPEGMFFFPEYALKIIEDDNLDWSELLSECEFGRAEDLRRNLTHIHLSGRLANLVYSMDATNTDFLAYQFKPVVSILESPNKGILIADEVGLGKTIEAGLIWTELRARYEARRLLVVCPAMLREKWCLELRARFGMRADIMNTSQLLKHLKQNKYETPEGYAVVCSLQGLRPTPNNVEEKKGNKNRKELARFLDEQSDNDPIIDMVIIDEAHYLRNPATQTAKLGQLLRGVSEYFILLSATPINLRSLDLFHLLKLVDQDSFDDKEIFPEVLAANQPLQQARELSLNKTKSSKEIFEKLSLAMSHRFFNKSRILKGLLESRLTDKDLENDAERIKLAEKIGKINLLRHAVTRTRHREVKEWRVLRETVKKFIKLDPDGPESLFYNAVTNTIREYAEERNISSGFLLAGPQRQISSCMYAAAIAWSNKPDDSKKIIKEQLYEDFGRGEDTDIEKLSPLIEKLTTIVLPSFDINELRIHDSKYNKFRETLVVHLTDNPNEKIIVFSFFRNTLHYLSERLSEDGIKSTILMGGMSTTKQDIIDEFETGDVQVLLCSEVASEGVDLQFCRILINYDLPWNPMKIEQRIGRIDRIGQKAKKINIINLLIENTIDHKIHDRLHDRIGIFKQALGGLEEILGELIQDLTKDLLNKPLTKNEEDMRIEQTALAIQKNISDQKELEGEASNLIAHGGYILDQINHAHQFKERIIDSDLMLYTKDYLSKYYQGYEFTQLNSKELKFNIRLPASFILDFEEFIKKKKLNGITRLPSGDTIMCLFTNKVEGRKEEYEVINQFHPLMRFITDDLKKRNLSSYPLVSLQVKLSDQQLFEKGDYAFFIYRYSFEGLNVEEELPMYAIHLQSGARLDLKKSWELVNHARLNGKDWLEACNKINIEKLHQNLNECISFLEKNYENVRDQKINENEDRCNFQIQSAIKRKERELESRYQALETLKKSNDEKSRRMIAPAEGRIRKINDKFEIRIEQLRNKTKLKSHPHEVCGGIIHCF